MCDKLATKLATILDSWHLDGWTLYLTEDANGTRELYKRFEKPRTGKMEVDELGSLLFTYVPPESDCA